LVGTGTKTDTTVKEVALAFLQYAESTKTKANFTHYWIATMDFMVTHYGGTPVADFNVGGLQGLLKRRV
jgi:hypothetical protein